jgi:hypothetical protein
MEDHMRDREHVQWRKSSRSGAGNACVEVANLSNSDRAVRDSKDRFGPALRFTASQWAVFTAGIHAEQFD